jgi:hypothetical protein
MASLAVSASVGVLASTDKNGCSAGKPLSKTRGFPAPVAPPASSDDDVNVSIAFILLSELEQQLKHTPEAAVGQALSNTASQILAHAEAENDPAQSQALENLASRLKLAALAGTVEPTIRLLSNLLDG